jgi:type II secretory pathway pseudopilin PulG
MKKIQNQKGVALMGVLVAVTILGLMSGIAGMTWTTKVQRAKEQELLWRGNQYRLAIESYYRTTHAGVSAKLPSSLDALVRDPRFVEPRRHIRKLYLDPITGEDWVLIKAPAGQITGVRSRSSDEPFKKEGFDEENEKFSGKESYSEWEFVFDVKAAEKADKKTGKTQTETQQSGQPSGLGTISSGVVPEGESK